MQVTESQLPSEVVKALLDVTNAESLDAAFAEIEEKLGPVEILVANAGITRDTLLMRMSDEDFEDVLNTNLTGSFRVLKRATKGMMKAKSAKITVLGAGDLNCDPQKLGLCGSPTQVVKILI